MIARLRHAAAAALRGLRLAVLIPLGAVLLAAVVLVIVTLALLQTLVDALMATLEDDQEHGR